MAAQREQYIKPKPKMDYKKISEHETRQLHCWWNHKNRPMQDFLDIPLFYLGPLDHGCTKLGLHCAAMPRTMVFGQMIWWN